MAKLKMIDLGNEFNSATLHVDAQLGDDTTQFLRQRSQGRRSGKTAIQQTC
jgi:hypothetical protein